MLFAAVLALALVSAAPAAFGQPVQAKISDDVNSQAEKGKAEANAGGAKAKAEPCPVGADAKAWDVQTSAPRPQKELPPPPPAATPPPPPPPAPPPPPPPP